METKKNITIEELEQLQRSNYLPLTVILVLIMFIGIVGNILVLIIYKRKFTRSSARCYILSLAIADLSVSVVGIPYHVLDLTLILTYTHTNVCRILSFLIGACTLSSVFILLVVGLDRYLKVCRPLKRQIKDFGDRKACLLASFVAIVISFPHGIIYGQSTVPTKLDNLTGVECFISDGYQGSELAVGYLGLNLLVFVMSVIFLIIIYGFICRKIYHHDRMSGEITLEKTKTFCFCCAVPSQDDESTGKNGTSGMDTGKADDIDETDKDPQCVVKESEIENGEGELLKSKLNDISGNQNSKGAARNSCAMVRHVRPGSKAVEKNTMKITLMMLTITVVFIISYLPFIIISILDSTDEDFWADRGIIESVFLDFMLRLYLVNNVANPIIYSFWDHRFRKETKLLLKKLTCCFKRKGGDNADNGNGNSALATSVGFSKCTEAVTLK
ncbi:orexin receptor type 2-like [Ruditapes philippinarum]|uniref:orexin receptor type 2-like n=1 Tax=Ruditapes philippinarum TaxID=129788 RepID=UPI00295B082E|nr:orexin receptor type 2-like [Ruditapes philippinarum]